MKSKKKNLGSLLIAFVVAISILCSGVITLYDEKDPVDIGLSYNITENI